MSLLTWTVSDSGGHFADFGRGRYSVARTYGRVPRFVARWHRSRDPFTQGQNITGAPTLEAAKVACERHADQRTPGDQLMAGTTRPSATIVKLEPIRWPKGPIIPTQFVGSWPLAK
jgi:hypothetical protein